MQTQKFTLRPALKYDFESQEINICKATKAN